MSDTAGSRKDRLLGILVALFSLAYIGYAASIEDSMLADSVGAGGVPLAIGIALLIAAAALAVKSFWVKGAAPGSGEGEETEQAEHSSGHVVAACLVALLIIYVALLPVAGYIVSVSLLVFAIAALAKTPVTPRLIVSAALSGILLWVLFELALGIHMPGGIFLS